MKAIKNWILTHKPLAGLLAAVLVFAGGFSVWWNNRPLDVLPDITVTFSGYDAMGKASYNEAEINQKILATFMAKAGFKKDEISAITEGNLSFNALSNVLNPETYKKAMKVQEMVSSVAISLSQTDNLSNGDKVVLSVSVKSKETPLVAGSKEFMVSGLKESQKKTAQDIFQEKVKEGQISVSGYNSDGVLSYSYSGLIRDAGKTSNLKNGDVITFQIPSSLVSRLAQEGVIVTGSSKVDWTVSGLKEIGKINRLSEVYPKLADYVKKTYQNTTGTQFTVTQMDGSFIRVDETSSYVTNGKDLYLTPTLFFKITQKDSSADKAVDRYVYVSSYFKLPAEGIDDKLIDQVTKYPSLRTISSDSVKNDTDLKNYILKDSDFVPYTEN